MNILIVNYEYPPIGGGASNASAQIAKEMVRLGHRVSILTSRFKELSGFSIEDGVHIYRVNSARKYQDHSSIFEMISFILFGFISIAKIVRTEKIDFAILFFSIPCGIFGPYLKRRFKIEYVVSLRGGDVPGLEPKLDTFHKLLAPLRKIIFKNAKSIIANSEGLASQSIKADPFPVSVIPNGVNTDFYFPDSSLKINDGIFRFLFVGRFQDQKNILVMLEQINQLKNLMPNSFLINIIGDGPLRENLLEYVRLKELERYVEFHKWFAKLELREMYQKSDCLINYSLYEGMPNVVMEAMACGLPVIASHIMGHDVLVINNENGFLIDLDKKELLLEKMKFAINNRENMLRMGLFARIMVKEKYTWENVGKSYLNLFN